MNEILTNLVSVLQEGFSMMLVGMGTVLCFLCIMILAMHIMSACVKKINEIFPEPVAQAAGGGKSKSAAKSDDSEVAAAIVAAMFSKK